MMKKVKVQKKKLIRTMSLDIVEIVKDQESMICQKTSSLPIWEVQTLLRLKVLKTRVKMTALMKNSRKQKLISLQLKVLTYL